MIQPDSKMGEHFSEIGVKEEVAVEPVTKVRKKILPVVKPVHEITKDDFSMKVMDHNYYVHDDWENYRDKNPSFIQALYQKISDILH